MLTELVVGGVAAIAGAALAWTICRARTKAEMEARLRQEELKAATASAQADSERKERSSAERESQRLREVLMQLEATKAAAETRSQETEKRLHEEKALLDQAREKLSDAFKALATEALDGSSKRFLILAEERMKAVKEEASGDLEARKVSIEALVKPLGAALTQYQTEATALEAKRQSDLGALKQQLEGLTRTHDVLQGETHRLVQALQSNTVRGQWGQVALRRIVDLAGMTPHCDFKEQESRPDGDGGRIQPDMVVKLPADREVVLDAKAPLAGYMEAQSAANDVDRKAALLRYACAVKGHVDDLAKKEYWDRFQKAPEFVVMFLPNDSFLAAAAEGKPELVDYAMERKVVIATPATLIALLKAVAYGWRQQQVAQEAQRIWALGMELSDRLGVLTEHLSGVGTGLKDAVKAYNQAVGSIESRLLASARKFKELGAGGKKDIQELLVVEGEPRAFAAEAIPPAKDA